MLCLFRNWGMSNPTIEYRFVCALLACCCITPSIHAQNIVKEVEDSVIAIDEKKVIIEQELQEFQGDIEWGYKRSLVSYNLKDSANNSHYTKEFTLRDASGGGFHDQFSIGISKLKTPGREALLISHGFLPSASGTGVDRQFFTWKKDSLVPLSGPFELSGRFGRIKRDIEGVDVVLSSTEVIMMTQHSTHHFYLEIPVIIDLDPTSSKTYRTNFPKDPESGYEIIPVTSEIHPDFIGGGSGQVRLYEKAGGNEYLTLQVQKDSEVKIGQAYGTTKIGQSETGVWISYEVKRLQVTIDGKSGFVEEKDYQVIGLPAFG
jgi:hypothetical protein